MEVLDIFCRAILTGNILGQEQEIQKKMIMQWG